jgi:hypothetical protein
MARDLGPLFRELAPPPGGLARLRDRLEAAEARRRRLALGWGAASALAAAALALVVTLTPQGQAPALPPLALRSPALVRLGIQSPPDAPVTVPPEARARIAVSAVPVTDPGVIYYRVDMLAPAE